MSQSNDNSPTGSSGSARSKGRVDVRDLLQGFADNGDQLAGVLIKNKDGPDRAAVGVISPANMTYDFMSPSTQPNGAFNTSFLGAPQKQDQVSRNQWAPRPKNISPSGERAMDTHQPDADMPMELGMPMLLECPILFEDEPMDQEMLIEEAPTDGSLPKLDPQELHGKGASKTTLLCSHSKEDTKHDINMALGILESTTNEITHQDEGCQIRAEYIYNNAHTGINICLCDAGDEGVAIQFTRAHGNAWEFQRFYRLVAGQLSSMNAPIRCPNGNDLPSLEIMDQVFDTRGLAMPDAKIVQSSLQDVLVLANGMHNSIRQWREFTDAIVHIAEQHPQLCLEFAATNKAPESHLVRIIINLMEKSRGDLKVMQNCARILSILVERGTDFDHQTQLYQLLHSGGKMPALNAVAACMAEWTTADREGGSALAMNTLFHFVELLITQYYALIGGTLSTQTVTALRQVANQKTHQRYLDIQSRLKPLLH